MPLPQKVNVQKAIKQKLQGMSYQQIADAQGCSKASVFQNINPILKRLADPETVQTYRQHQAEILDGLAAQCVSSITTEDMEKASLQQKIVSAGILIDKSRLIQGQSTSNTSIVLKAIMASQMGAEEGTLD